MRILYLDIDTLRPDHLGCYGYHRRTSPNIDAVANSGVRFENCYASDVPCLPSRAALFTGQFGIHNGVVGHGGTAADLRIIGPERRFRTDEQRTPFVMAFDLRDWLTATFSTFGHRHSAWWFYGGWREMYNNGKHGHELAEEVFPRAVEWLKRNGRRDNWFLHVHVWDPHIPYRTPESFGNPFADEPVDGWFTEEMRRRQWDDFGPTSPQEGPGFGGFKGTPRQPAQIASMADYKKQVDGYDCGIAYADRCAGQLFNALADLGLMDDTIVMISSDHGENLGELAVHGDHATADHITNRVPMILRGPGLPGGRVEKSLHYAVDSAATLLELSGIEVPPDWDGESFAPSLKAGRDSGRDHLVVGQCAWSCERAVRWDDYMFIRSFHTGLKHFPARMLFNVAKDPHETTDLAASRGDLADRAEAMLEEWTTRMMSTNADGVDPLWTVMREGGPWHTRGKLAEYCVRLRATGRAKWADFLEKHPTGIE